MQKRVNSHGRQETEKGRTQNRGEPGLAPGPVSVRRFKLVISPYAADCLELVDLAPAPAFAAAAVAFDAKGVPAIAAITPAPSGLPRPVHASQPLVALNEPLLPTVMS